MTWICPVCKKEFEQRMQPHTCARVPVDVHFQGKPPIIRMIYDRLIQEANRFGRITVNPTESSIEVKSSATFLTIRPLADRAEIEFFLRRVEDREPITSSTRISRERVLHTATLDNIMQVKERLVGWLRESYDLVTVGK